MILQGDARAVLTGPPDRSVHICVTSPPYWRLRRYLPAGHPDAHLEIGTEETPDCFGWATGARCGQCYICHLVEVFAAVRRVLRDDGTLWVVLSGSFAGAGYSNHANTNGARRGQGGKQAHAYVSGYKNKDYI